MNFQQPVQNIQLPEAVKNMGEGLGNTIEQAKSGFNNAVSGFSAQTQAGVTASQGFLQSNTIVAKFAFIILIVIVFVFLFAMGINLIQYFISPPTNPYVVRGMVDGTSNKSISTDPAQTNAVVINRSNNQSKGLEFTWSFWLYIDDLGTNPNMYQHVFNKGDSTYDKTTGISTVNNGPGVYIKTSSDSLSATMHVIMNTSSQLDTQNFIDIDKVPLRKWVHVALRMQNTILDIYINGIVSNRLIMQQVPKQNYNDINIGKNGGFAGKLSNLRYFCSALNAFDINSIVSAGPNTTQGLLNSNNNNYTYLSSNWYSARM